jgi:hypothetical protein
LVISLMGFFIQVVRNVRAGVNGLGTVHDARSLEALVEEQVKALGALILEAAWRLRMKGRRVPRSLPCPCGRVQHFVDRRPCTVRGVLGPLELEDRYYYRCDQCGATGWVGDELRGATVFTPLVEERMAWVGKDGAYAKAAATLKRLGIIQVASSTVRKVCGRLGQRVRARMDAEAREQYGKQRAKAERQPQRLGISVDGTMLGRIDPQHRRRRSRKTGRRVPGKGALHHFFQEVKTLVVFEFDARGEVLRQTYHATQARVEAFREQVRLEAQKCGAESAKALVFIGDGAAWVWGTADEHFPRATQILDWYHAMEHVWAVGRARYGSNDKAVRCWVKRQEKNLAEGRVQAVIRAVRKASKELGAPDASLSEKAREKDPRWVAWRNVGYFEDNRTRMDYPQYRARGLPIGSGVVESACKHVVADRMKRTGMRWDEEGAENLLALRCWALNGRWDSLWPAKEAG